MKKLLLSVIVLNLLVAGILISDMIDDRDREPVTEFQRLVKGLGLGASVNPRWGFNIFDPRVERVDETNLFPIAGGYIYLPSRGMCLSEFSEAF